jgi:phage shock protein PspC (stress-responsive transcriptional regulator)
MTNSFVTKPLRRSRTDKVVAGICGGFARYLGIDPVAARVLYVLLTFLTGGALILGYLIIWLVMPEEEAAPTWPTATYPPGPTYPPTPPTDTPAA